MTFLIYGLIAIAAYFIIGWLYFTIKAFKDPDVQEASKLRMSVKNFRKYREIYDEQIACYKSGKTPPDRTDEIKNFNDWRRYGDYRQKLADIEYMESLPEPMRESFKQMRGL